MSKYYDMSKLPTGPVEFKLSERSLPAYKLFFRDGYSEIIIQFPGDPPVGFSKRFEELVANHGTVIDFYRVKMIDNEELRKELNKRYGCKETEETIKMQKITISDVYGVMGGTINAENRD